MIVEALALGNTATGAQDATGIWGGTITIPGVTGTEKVTAFLTGNHRRAGDGGVHARIEISLDGGATYDLNPHSIGVKVETSGGHSTDRVGFLTHHAVEGEVTGDIKVRARWIRYPDGTAPALEGGHLVVVVGMDPPTDVSFGELADITPGGTNATGQWGADVTFAGLSGDHAILAVLAATRRNAGNGGVLTHLRISLDGQATWSTGAETMAKWNASSTTDRHAVPAVHGVDGTVTGDVVVEARWRRDGSAGNPVLEHGSIVVIVW